MPLTRAEYRKQAAAPVSDAETAAVQAVAAMGDVIALIQATDTPALRRRRTRAVAADSSAADLGPVSLAESVVSETIVDAVIADSVPVPSADVASVIAASPVAQTPVASVPLRRRVRAARSATAEATATPEATPVREFLDETIVLPSADSTHASGHDAAPGIDEFELAAKVFSFTGETPIQVARAAADADEQTQRKTRVRMADQPPRPRRGRVVFKRLAAASFSVSVVGVVGLLAIGTTTPVAAVGAFGQEVRGDMTLASEKTTTEAPEIQAYVSGSTAAAGDLARSDEYDIESMADVAAESGVTKFAGTWVNDATAEVQWPFPVGVPISAQFGSTSYLSKFSRVHHGTDFTPGRGAEIHAVAAGTVRIATEAGGDYGVTVVLDHIIDGQLVSTRYGHMEYGSLRVSPGETVKAGQVLGKVGSTGKSTGPHLHLEVLLGGTTRIDPLPWLKEHTRG
ncbi:M23 family metallopeptidase [Microbacterium sp. 77mftsu3.1]|uniref:M23 family metallopeptidase n=1 Tax=Microbacterium sp. 77mftsu3.1 TaxID=1761802 RepID=UPI00036BF8AA|nr:M23 family metallopeptidase [Microbacterium sp. 77mftsu3.1]SDG88035.1 Peptidase family M23 [Microbacterium sp. 77mftsu3.1]